MVSISKTGNTAPVLLSKKVQCVICIHIASCTSGKLPSVLVLTPRIVDGSSFVPLTARTGTDFISYWSFRPSIPFLHLPHSAGQGFFFNISSGTGKEHHPRPAPPSPPRQRRCPAGRYRRNIAAHSPLSLQEKPARYTFLSPETVTKEIAKTLLTPCQHRCIIHID